MKKSKIFIVFHYNLEDKYNKDILDNATFISVNNKIEKVIKINTNFNSLKESDITGFKDYQSLKYNESSAIINLSNIIDSYNIDNLTFIQYDDFPNSSFLEEIRNLEDECLCIRKENPMCGAINEFIYYFNLIINEYNNTFNDNYNLHEVIGPLYSTFTISISEYKRMINFYYNCEYIINLFIEKFGTRHIAGFMERFWCIYLGLRFKNKLILSTNIVHNNDIRDRIFNNH